MGHYRSEMGWETYDKEEAERAEKKIQKRAEEIQKMIDEKGIARVLAEAEVSTFANELLWKQVKY